MSEAHINIDEAPAEYQRADNDIVTSSEYIENGWVKITKTMITRITDMPPDD